MILVLGDRDMGIVSVEGSVVLNRIAAQFVIIMLFAALSDAKISDNGLGLCIVL